MHVVLRPPTNKPCLLGKAVLYHLFAVGMCKVEIEHELPDMQMMINTKKVSCSIAKVRWHCNIFCWKIQYDHSISLAVKYLLTRLT